MRPTYEKRGDRINERVVAGVVAEITGLTLREMPKFHPLDYSFSEPGGRTVLAVEIKCRTNLRSAYPTYMLALQKYRMMVEIQEMRRHPVWLVVQWRDELGHLSIPAPHTDGFGGRQDRGDPRDQERVVYFPVADFKPIDL